MDMPKLMKYVEDNKADFYKKMLEEEQKHLTQLSKVPQDDFKGLLSEARSDPKVNAYLDMLLTKEQVIGYLLAAMRSECSFMDASDQSALIIAMEQKFLTMLPEEAERIYAESWYIGQKKDSSQ